MKLSDKVIIIIAVVETFFLSISIASGIRFSLFDYVMLAGLNAVLLFLLIRIFVIKRINELNQELQLINEKKSNCSSH